MKKSMVFTTIAMILVVVVALTTATFAWFSQSDAMTVTAGDYVAGSSDAKIMLRKLSTQVRSTSLDFSAEKTAAFAGGLPPMMPTASALTLAQMQTAAPDTGEAGNSGVMSNIFYTATQRTANGKTYLSGVAAQTAFIMGFGVSNVTAGQLTAQIDIVRGSETAGTIDNDGKWMALKSMKYAMFITDSAEDPASVAEINTDYFYGLKSTAWAASTKDGITAGDGTTVAVPTWDADATTGFYTADRAWIINGNDTDYTKVPAGATVSSVVGTAPKTVAPGTPFTNKVDGYKDTYSVKIDPVTDYTKELKVYVVVWFDGFVSADVMAQMSVPFSIALSVAA